MSAQAFLQDHNWLIAATVMVAVISWVALILQALFADIRIALVGVFGSLLFSFLFLLPAVWGSGVKYASALLCVLFFLVFVIQNIRQAKVFLPAMGVVLSALSTWWLMHQYHQLLSA